MKASLTLFRWPQPSGPLCLWQCFMLLLYYQTYSCLIFVFFFFWIVFCISHRILCVRLRWELAPLYPPRRARHNFTPTVGFISHHLTHPSSKKEPKSRQDILVELNVLNKQKQYLSRWESSYPSSFFVYKSSNPSTHVGHGGHCRGYSGHVGHFG